MKGKEYIRKAARKRGAGEKKEPRPRGFRRTGLERNTSVEGYKVVSPAKKQRRVEFALDTEDNDTRRERVRERRASGQLEDEEGGLVGV